jgi:UDP-N-acetylglucosamine--N-acetylmuramyl-(pentapeptide) pyrophosphoryl-undecaprenol N-acetylglucosamine transferase
VPSPNVAEDHQTKNAMALVERGAAEIVRDAEAVERGMQEAVALASNRERLAALRENIGKLAIADSAERVVREIEQLLNNDKSR